MATSEDIISKYKQKGYNIVIIDFATQRTERAVLREFASALRFPDYFGYNWDALDECLRDLEWLSTKNTLVIFRNLDKAFDRDLARKIVNWVEQDGQEIKAEGFDFVTVVA